MEKIHVNCNCKNCQCEFIFEKTCENGLEAEKAKKWAARYKKICPVCLEKEREQQRAERAQMLGLPQVIGCSNKQIAYAEKLRDRYIVANMEYVLSAKEHLEKIDPARVERIAKQWGLENEMCIPEAFKGVGMYEEYICLTEENASKIIEVLK